jgi:uncharacterized protein (DUF362 family)
MAVVSISTQATIEYPKDGPFSPADHHPEYPFDPSELSSANDVYGLVRRCLAEFGCDRLRLGTSEWNPFGEWAPSGSKIFVLPNFVMHRRATERADEFEAKCTHGSVLRAVLDYAVIAAGEDGQVAFGNAPLQACNYRKVVEETGTGAVERFFDRQGYRSLSARDLRLFVSRWSFYGALLETAVVNPEDAVEVDLGEHSLLEELYRDPRHEPEFRVGDYSPELTVSYHSRGRHVYVVNRHVLEADVIISVPKLKTHEKVGITCALKGTVGSIGRKECLAHHRRGGPQRGGDEFPRSTVAREIVSRMLDETGVPRTDPIMNARRVGTKALSKALRLGGQGIMNGAWSGNDTAWRMALDIARILRYARPDGTLRATPVRHHLALVDGIVGGEGEGPLRPSPRRSGLVLFSPDVCAADTACATVMGYEPRHIPLVANCFAPHVFPLTEGAMDELQFVVNGQSVASHQVTRAQPPYAPPKGWRKHLAPQGSDGATATHASPAT